MVSYVINTKKNTKIVLKNSNIHELRLALRGVRESRDVVEELIVKTEK